MEICEVCKKEIKKVFNLGLCGEDDFYQFDVCEDCLNFYHSDVYTAEDVLEQIEYNEKKVGN